MRWKILVADQLAKEGMEILSEAGEVTCHKGMGASELATELPGKHALIVRSATRVTADCLACADELVVIGRAGIGVDNVDLQAATDRGIVVMNTPDSGAVTTAEHAIAMLLSLARRIPTADRLMHDGRWEKGALTGVEITGKTLGMIGLGRIGRVVADRAMGLRMRILAYDPYVPNDRMPDGVLKVPLERCLAESDFLTIHVPLSDETRYLIGANAFAQMKSGARLIQCARGGIVDEAALVEALASGQLAGAALDVFETEPLPRSHALASHPNVILTPHLGASTEEAKGAVARDIARQLVECLTSGIVVNGVNVPRIAPRDAEYLAPFLKLAGCLASLLVQAFPGKLERLRVVMQGEVAERGVEVIPMAALVGALRSGPGLNATPVNVRSLAGSHGIVFESETKIAGKEYVDLIRVEAVIDGEVFHTSGTLLGKRGLRIVELDGTSLDAKPSGHMLLTFHRDQPGVIGHLGTLLGNAKVNISRMQLGLRDTEHAMGLLNLDSEPPAQILEEIRALPFVSRVALVSLAPDGERELAPLRRLVDR